MMPRHIAQKIIQKLGNLQIKPHGEYRWNQVSIDILVANSFVADDFAEAVWTEDIDKGCSEPYKYHIKTFHYIYDAYDRTGATLAMWYSPETNEVVELGKWDIRGLDEERGKDTPHKHEDIWFIQLEDVDDEVDSMEELEDDEAVKAWNDYQKGIPRDEYSEEAMKRIEEQVEFYYERLADIQRGK
jgi:hypothetical protein